jgi:hypothetical protein
MACLMKVENRRFWGSRSVACTVANWNKAWTKQFSGDTMDEGRFVSVLESARVARYSMRTWLSAHDVQAREKRLGWFLARSGVVGVPVQGERAPHQV